MVKSCLWNTTYVTEILTIRSGKLWKLQSRLERKWFGTPKTLNEHLLFRIRTSHMSFSIFWLNMITKYLITFKIIIGLTENCRVQIYVSWISHQVQSLERDKNWSYQVTSCRIKLPHWSFDKMEYINCTINFWI